MTFPPWEINGEVDGNEESRASTMNKMYQEDDSIDLFIDSQLFNLYPI